VLEDAWVGIDLRHVRADVVADRWYQIRQFSVTEVLDSPVGAALRRLPDELFHEVAAALGSVSADLPFLRDSRRRFVSNHSYMEVNFVAQAFDSGHYGFQIYVGRVDFEAEWSNPLWTLAGFDLASALPSLASSVHEALAAATKIHWKDEELAHPTALRLPPVPSFYQLPGVWLRRASFWIMTRVTSGKGTPLTRSEPPGGALSFARAPPLDRRIVTRSRTGRTLRISIAHNSPAQPSRSNFVSGAQCTLWLRDTD